MINFKEEKDKYLSLIKENSESLSQFLLERYMPSIHDKLNNDKHIPALTYGRSSFFFNTILPWINDYIDIKNSSFIEIGPGTGSTTAPLAMLAKEIEAYDISTVSSQVAQFRCDLLSLSNVKIHTYEPQTIFDKILNKHNSAKVNAVLFFAVLEHMKIDERIHALKTAWQVLDDDGLLIVGDTPNRLSYFHGHTSRMPFFDMLPSKISLQYRDKMKNKGFSSALNQWKTEGLADSDITDKIDRWGRGVSFHEFELAIGNLNTYTVAEGLERRLIRAINLSKEDKLLMQYLNYEMPDIPLGYGRQSLYIILQKNTNPKKNIKKFDEDLIRNLISL